tara:strand:- start:7248 stop:7562 length:315 start_codon:yes stop_codon:yes gene_type:complete
MLTSKQTRIRILLREYASDEEKADNQIADFMGRGRADVMDSYKSDNGSTNGEVKTETRDEFGEDPVPFWLNENQTPIDSYHYHPGCISAFYRKPRIIVKNYKSI